MTDHDRVVDLSGRAAAILLIDLHESRNRLEHGMFLGKTVDHLERLLIMITVHSEPGLRTFGHYGRSLELIDQPPEVVRQFLSDLGFDVWTLASLKIGSTAPEHHYLVWNSAD